MAKKISWNSWKPSKVDYNSSKLRLEKGEKARISFLDPAPTAVYIHTFETVVLDEMGEPIIEEKNGLNGNTWEAPKTKYAGKFLCPGDDDERSSDGLAPESCPACRAHLSNPDAVKKPQQRILAHVLKYNVKPGGFTPAKPFSATLLVWDLTEKRFGTINQIFKEFQDEDPEIEDMAQFDLLLGPCESEQMQKYDIRPAPGDAYWAANSHEEVVAEILKEQRIDDLSAVAGKMPLEREIAEKVNQVVREYNHAFNPGGVPSQEESILGSNATQVARKAAKVEEVSEDEADSDEDSDDEVDETIDEETGEVISASDDADDQDEEEAEEAPAPKRKKGRMSLDALIDSIN